MVCLACFSLSVADLELESWVPNDVLTVAVTKAHPPDTVALMLNWLLCWICEVVDWVSSLFSVTPVSL